MAPLKKTQAPAKKTKRLANQPPVDEATGAKRRRSHPRAAAVAGEASRTRSLAPGGKPPFEPAVEDSRGRFGEISYAKSWCGFLNPRESSSTYKKWRDQVKAYITVLGWNPTCLTDSQLESVLSFARSLPPVRGRIKLIETKHRPADVAEVERQIKLLVRDTAKKLQATNDRLHAERAEDALDAEVTELQTAQPDWASPYCPRAIRLHIVRRTGAPEVGHPFLHHAWYSTDPGEGIAWGVLASPSIQTLLGVLKRQHVEETIRYPRYLIGATGQGASSLRRRPSEPLPLSELIFLYTDDDIRAWLLANPGKDPLDLLVLESRHDQGRDRDETPAPASGRYPFFDRKVWDRWGQTNDTIEEEDDDEGRNDNSANYREDNSDESHSSDVEEMSGDTLAPSRRGEIISEDDDRDTHESQRRSCSGSDYSPARDPPGRHTRNSQRQDSDSGPPQPSDQDQFESMRALLQEKPWMAQWFKNPDKEPVGPEPGPATVASKTRERRGSGRGLDGTADSPAAQPQPAEDSRNLDRATSHTPIPQPTAPAATALTALTTSPPSATTTPTTPSALPGMANPPSRQQTTAPRSRDPSPPNATNTVEKETDKNKADSRGPKQPISPTHPTPRRGKKRRERR